MSMSIVAILLSLAMMLTGAGSSGQPDELSRTLRISDIAIQLNGQEIEFDSTLRLGASNKGQTPLFDLAVEKDGKVLFPIQLSADENQVALVYGDQGFALPTATVDALIAQAQQQMTAAAQSNPETQAMMEFLTQEMLPAYAGMMDAVQDPERVKEINAKAQAAMLQIVDRGEGVEDTIVLADDNEYAVVRYNYTLNAQQMLELADAVYQCDEALANYYNAMMKMYSMMPEESGMKGITSFADLAKMIDLDMTMEITETVSEADGLDMIDAVLTINIPAQAMGAPEGTELPPMVFTIAAYEMGDNGYAQVNLDYDIEGNCIVYNMTMEKDESGMAIDMDMTVNAVDAEGNTATMASITMEGGSEKDEKGVEEYSLEYDFDLGQQGQFNCSIEGANQPDGTGEAAVALSVAAQGMTAGLSFNLTVSGEAIVNAADTADITLIEDLSDEGMAALQQDQAFQQKMMTISSRLMLDLQELKNDSGVQTVLQLYEAITKAS